MRHLIYIFVHLLAQLAENLNSNKNMLLKLIVSDSQ